MIHKSEKKVMKEINLFREEYEEDVKYIEEELQKIQEKNNTLESKLQDMNLKFVETEELQQFKNSLNVMQEYINTEYGFFSKQRYSDDLNDVYAKINSVLEKVKKHRDKQKILKVSQIENKDRIVEKGKFFESEFERLWEFAKKFVDYDDIKELENKTLPYMEKIESDLNFLRDRLSPSAFLDNEKLTQNPKKYIESAFSKYKDQFEEKLNVQINQITKLEESLDIVCHKLNNDISIGFKKVAEQFPIRQRSPFLNEETLKRLISEKADKIEVTNVQNSKTSKLETFSLTKRISEIREQLSFVTIIFSEILSLSVSQMNENPITKHKKKMYLLNQLNLISKWIINSAEGTKSQESIPKDLKDLHNFAFLLKAKHNASPSVQEIRQFYKNDPLSVSTSTNTQTNLQFAGAGVNASVHVLQNPPISKSLNSTATAITPINTANMLGSLKSKSNFVHMARVHLPILPLKSASNVIPHNTSTGSNVKERFNSPGAASKGGGNAITTRSGFSIEKDSNVFRTARYAHSSHSPTHFIPTTPFKNEDINKSIIIHSRTQRRNQKSQRSK